MIAFFHYVNFPLSTRRFFKPKSYLFYTTMSYKENIALNNNGTCVAHFFFDRARKDCICASDYHDIRLRC